MKILALSSMSICFVLLPSFAKAQSSPACNAAQVTYESAPKDIEDRIRVVKETRPSGPPATGTRVNSTHGTRWLVQVDPNYRKAGPWTTTLYVGNSDSRQPYLLASFRDHGNTFSAHWINEDLLFVQVWWGRIASSDLILDVTTGRFIYDRLANYGQTAQPCAQ
jgi:hypothetical protein